MGNLSLYSYENTTPKKKTGELGVLEVFCSEDIKSINTFLEKYGISSTNFLFALEAHSPFYFVSIEEYEEEKRKDGYDEDYLIKMVDEYRIEYNKNIQRELLFFNPNDILAFFFGCITNSTQLLPLLN